MIDIDYSFERRPKWAQIVEELHPELFRRGLRRGLTAAARAVYRSAVRSFDAAVPALAGRVGRAIGYRTHRDLSGFRVRVLRSGRHSLLRNSRGKDKPLALFLEHGATDRMTRGRSRRAHSTGSIEAAAAMQQTEAAFPVGTIDRMLIADIDRACQKIFEKYG